MSEMAKGTFEVKASPVAADAGDESGIGRLTLDKKFSGDLEGTSQGQMLGFRTAMEGSAGYVAMEKVIGTDVSKVKLQDTFTNEFAMKANQTEGFKTTTSPAGADG